MMNPSEKIAKALLEQITNGTMVFRESQSRGEWDFDLHYPTGGIGFVEVTSCTNEVLEEHISVGEKHKRVITAQLCKRRWDITVLPSTKFSRLHKSIDRYLSILEAENIFRFNNSPHSKKKETIKRICDELEIRSGHSFESLAPKIIISGFSHGDFYDPHDLVSCIDCILSKPDNLLLKAQSDAERHLFIYISELTTAHIVLNHLSKFMTPIPITLPKEITHLWIATPKLCDLDSKDDVFDYFIVSKISRHSPGWLSGIVHLPTEMRLI
jgi:hypothetical protein